MQLYQHIRAESPDKYYPLINMGVIHFKAGALDIARVHFERYLEAVGGVNGDGELLDRHARQLGRSPCNPGCNILPPPRRTASTP